MATTMMEDPGVVKVPLISWTLACLLYTLLIHIVLDAVSAEALHVSSTQTYLGRLLINLTT